jgi:UDP-N-acetylglucosamine diphosphorylase/glucosamine-1-phosphate N-acetyltransferase
MRPETVVVVETSAEAAEAFYPFGCLHCLWEVRWGPLRLQEWWQRRFPEAQLWFAVPPERMRWRQAFLARFPVFQTHRLQLPALILNAQLLPTQQSLSFLEREWHGEERGLAAVFAGDTLAAVWVGTSDLPPELAALRQGVWDDACAEFCRRIPASHQELPIVRFLWEVIVRLPEAFAELEQLLPLGVDAELWHRRGVWIVAPERVWIAPTADLAPGVVLDARQGMIVLEEGVIVQPNAVLLGPCSVGAHSLLRAHTTVGSNTVIGEQCRIGGEVAQSVFHAYANKQHEGFVGHSYIGEWVNLGAGTTTSNLKNTYGTVRVLLPSGEQETGTQFLGTLCGDHTKTAIGTFLRTGAVLGVSANVLSGGMRARLVPSFAWGDVEHPQSYALAKALEVARRAMSRRGRSLLPEEEELLRCEYHRWWNSAA